jgi:hypothetical protein
LQTKATPRYFKRPRNISQFMTTVIHYTKLTHGLTRSSRSCHPPRHELPHTADGEDGFHA